MKLFKNIYFLYTIIFGLLVIMVNQWGVMSELIDEYNSYQEGINATYMPKIEGAEVKAPQKLYFEGTYCVNQIGYYEYVIFSHNNQGTVFAPSYSGSVTSLEFRYQIDLKKREAEIEFTEGVLRDGSKLPEKFRDLFKILSWSPQGKIKLIAGWHGVISDNCKYTETIKAILQNYPNNWKKLLMQLHRKQLDAMRTNSKYFSESGEAESNSQKTNK